MYWYLFCKFKSNKEKLQHTFNPQKAAKMKKLSNNKAIITGIIIVFCTIIFSNKSQSQSITDLIAQEKYTEAEEYCKTLTGEKQKKAYNELAEAFFSNQNFEKAVEIYSKAENFTEIVQIGDLMFDKEKYQTALDYYTIAFEQEGDFFFFQKMLGLSNVQVEKIFIKLGFSQIFSETDSIAFKIGDFSNVVCRINDNKVKKIIKKETKITWEVSQKEIVKERITILYNSIEKYNQILGSYNDFADKTDNSQSEKLSTGEIFYEWLPNENRENYKNLYYKIEIDISDKSGSLIFSQRRIFMIE